MRALFVNEIKQNIEGSGLGPLNVGSNSIKAASNYIRAVFPNIAKDAMFLNDLQVDSIDGVKGLPDVIIRDCEKYLGSNVKDLRLIDEFKLNPSESGEFTYDEYHDYRNWLLNIESTMIPFPRSIKYEVGKDVYSVRYIDNNRIKFVCITSFIKISKYRDNKTTNDWRYLVCVW